MVGLGLPNYVGTIQHNWGNKHFSADGDHGRGDDTNVFGTRFNWSGGAMIL